MIFCLSCTGNTLWAAKRLHEATGEELVNMAQTYAETTLGAGERIGFCFPVHGWRPPELVRRFIKGLRLRVAPDTFCYAVCTIGDTAGEAIDILKSDLAAVGITLHSAYSLQMPNTYVGLPFMDVDPVALQKSKKVAAEADLNRYITQIVDRKTGCFNVVRGRWPRINSRLLGALFHRFLVSDKCFHINNDRCVGCGKCASACPVGDIVHRAGQAPSWRGDGRCLTCFACYHHCPHHAVEFGRRTKRKGQYFFK